MGVVTLADLDALDFPALWASAVAPNGRPRSASPPSRNSSPGSSPLTTGPTRRPPDRNIAFGMASEAYEGIADAVEQAFPEIEWWTD